jgi:hypothetical protein
MRELQDSEFKTIETAKEMDHRTYFGDDYTQEEVEEIFEGNGLLYGAKEKRAALCRSANVHVDATVWMEEYFDKFDFDPTSKQIHVDACFKRSIYQEYLKSRGHNRGCETPFISEGQFKSIWGIMFDHVRIRQIKRVSGKCWTCAYINETMKRSKSSTIMEACKSLMIMHRGGLFMLERSEYRRRVREAIELNPGKVMSSIIDGASQNHCTIPHAGPSQQFSKGLEQHIE